MTSDTRDDGTEDGIAAGSPARVRYPTAIAMGGGLAAAVGSSFIPMNAIEGFVSAYGIAELLPAAAPPLGTTARLALSTGLGTLTAGALLALLPRGENDVMGYETVVKTDAANHSPESEAVPARSGSGLSKLGGWLRTLRFGKAEPDEDEVTDFADLNRLRMRVGDQHPDAPVRAPIMANSDLGVPFDSPTDTNEAAQADEAMSPSPDEQQLDLDASMALAPAAEPAPSPAAFGDPAMRFAPPAEHFASKDDDSETWAANADRMVNADTVDDSPAIDALSDADPDDLTQIAIPELLDRLERGLARRRERAFATADGGRMSASVAAVPPAFTPAPVQPDPGSDGSSASRFRLRMTPAVADDAAEAVDDTASRIARLQGPLDIETSVTLEDTQPDAAESGVTAQDEPTGASPPADEDMDAALRDALATLRQLSDRQRNA
ncbi:hypothetical protein [Blastomonas sp.]|uniref:hypothetical protein n=1 Tax=Blastomonas sp. TaxID=1909299 RepID=UPI002613AC49|nr:hypothetical protein [Blastomonas sp.]MDM7954929.1 hypothetical protein [Blastomonas sp.]